MTIKEMEARSGMTRANIRFYEAEGLLRPVRLENGYRDYAEADLAELLRIRLMRALGVPLEEIRALQRGERELPALLRRRLEEMDAERSALEKTQAVCRAISEEAPAYEALDAARYLDALQGASSVLASDVPPRVDAPWRRFFARAFDTALYSVVLTCVLLLVFHVNIRLPSSGQTYLRAAAVLAMMLFLEPLFLSRLGTTPGKWVLGLRVTDPYGGRLTYADAFSRTIGALWYGLGFRIPFLHIYRLFRTWRSIENNELLPWEQDSALVLRDRKLWRAAAYVGLLLLLIGVGALAFIQAERPPHRGDLTVAELCDNYDRLAAYHGYDADESQVLDPEGRWVPKRTAPNSFVLDTWELFDTERPALQFETENGFVTAVSFTVTMTGDYVIDPGTLPLGSGTASGDLRFDMRMMYALPEIEALLTLSFAGAQKDAGLMMQEARTAASYILDHPGQDLTLYAYGLSITSVTESDAAGTTVRFRIGI